jgi:hypothetical protein
MRNKEKKMTAITKTDALPMCAYCKTVPVKRKEAKFCSPACTHAHLRSVMAAPDPICAACKKPFKSENPPCRHPMYCSSECRRSVRGSNRKCACGCGKMVRQDGRKCASLQCRKNSGAAWAPYTDFERAFIRANYYKVPVSEIGAMLNRSVGSIVSLAWRTGISTKSRSKQPSNGRL